MTHHHRTCAVCAKPFVYHPAGKDKGREHVRGLCCSMVCKSQYVRANRQGRYSAIYSGYCEECSRPFVSRRVRPHCGDLCWARARATVRVFDKACAHCGSAYQVSSTGGKPTQYCSDGCRDMVAAARKRSEKAKRKAVLKGATVESVDPFVVFDRDGWRCQLCGDPTPKEKRGTHADDAPELDHVVPLAEGGEHSYANTQCACRLCNGAKSNNISFESAKISMLLG